MIKPIIIGLTFSIDFVLILSLMVNMYKVDVTVDRRFFFRLALIGILFSYIVCDLELFKVIGGVSNIFTKQMRLYGRNQVYRRVKVVIKVVGLCIVRGVMLDVRVGCTNKVGCNEG